MAGLVDQWGRPVDGAALRAEQGRPTVTGIRQPVGGHPASGLTPQRLARLLRDAEVSVPERYLELAEDMEERELHYAAVLGVRKRQVAGLEITVEAATDAAGDVAAADLVRDFLNRDELADELIDVLDAIGKGFACTEICWETSERQWRPARLEWADPRFFDFDRETRRIPLLRGAGGELEPLAPFRWITHFAKAKSGLPIRGGLARPVAWGFMFKSFSIKDWAVFCEAYGQPLRVGKYGPGASQADKDILLAAVTNLGSDAGAIIPESMVIEFVSAQLAGNHELFEKHADWWDRQVSKIVLGQTGTTDAIAGGYAVGKVQDGVRDDIAEADARQLAATLNRDLVRPLVALNMGPQPAYPKIRIGRPDDIDVDKLVGQVARLVPLGLKVGMSSLRDKMGLPDPADDEDLLAPAAAAVGPAALEPATPPAALGRQAASAAPSHPDAIDGAIDGLIADGGWERMLEPVIAGLEARLAGASADQAVEILADHLRHMDVTVLATKLAEARFAARLAGEIDQPLSDKV